MSANIAVEQSRALNPIGQVVAAFSNGSAQPVLSLVQATAV
jgi:hypothetical protein